MENRQFAAEFASAEAMLAAARQLVEQGYRVVDAYSPFPVEELEEILSWRRPRIAPVVFAAGALGAVVAIGGQHWLNAVNYPIEVGGRPNSSWITYVVIGFELTVLFAAFASFAAVLLGAKLPRLHDPIFDLPNFERATTDRFWLTIEGDPERELLEGAIAIHEVTS